MTSGSASRSSSQVIQGECRPAVPNRLSPPAIATSSGIQLPPAISGSIHSMQATVGRAGSVCAIAATAAMRALRSAISSRPRADAPIASATFWMSVQMSTMASGFSVTMSGVASSQSQTAARRSFSLTAQTSHCDWVTMTSGLNAFNASPSTR